MGGMAMGKSDAERERLNEELNKRARIGDIAGLNAALSSGADPLAKDASGMTPLMRACWHMHEDCIERLIPLSDPKARNLNRSTALIMACRGAGAPERVARCVELLLPGSDPLAVDHTGRNALMISARDDELGAWFFKVLTVSDPWAVDKDGKSALDFAQERGRKEFCKAFMALHEANDLRARLASGAVSAGGTKLRV